jgi:membrane-bound metal-dependent hydrolase YbcI (DUF457 family)
MSSVLGHGLAGMSVWALARRLPALRALDHKAWFAAAAAAGCLPDLDSLIGLHHRGPTHTLGFALATGGLVAAGLAVRGLRREAAMAGPAFVLAVWLHPVFDLLSGGGPQVALFAPFWWRPLTPVAGGLPLHSFTTAWGSLLDLLLDPWTVRGMAIEALIFGPLFGATVAQRHAARVGLAAVGSLSWVVFAVLAQRP